MNGSGGGGGPGSGGQGVVIIRIRKNGIPHSQNVLVTPGQRVKFVSQGGPNTFVAKFNKGTPFKGGKTEFRDCDEEEVLPVGTIAVSFKYDVDPGDGGAVIDPIITVRGTSRSITFAELQMIADEVEDLSESLSMFQERIRHILETPEG